MKKVLNSALYVLYILVIVFLFFEILLRFFYPIETRISSGKIVLPKNQSYFLPNKNFSKLQKDAKHTKNAWGFRGPEWEPNSSKTKIIFVGGSTTECFYLDDKNIWTKKYANTLDSNYLVNNAGLNGHSTVGHISLLKDYIQEIKPNYVFFLAGINDLAVTENGGNAFDNIASNSGMTNFILKLEENSRVLNLMHMMYRSYQAKKMDLADNMEWNLKEKESDYQLEEDKKLAIFEKHKAGQKEYEQRLKKLIEICKSVNATPVFISQPLLFGKGIDPSTQIDLENYKIYGLTGKEYLKKLSFYNETMKKVAQENSLLFIDLANELKPDSKYYIDDMHFSDEGAAEIARILSEKNIFSSNSLLEMK